MHSNHIILHAAAKKGSQRILKDPLIAIFYYTGILEIILSQYYSLFYELLSSALSRLIELGELGPRLSGVQRDEAISLIRELKSKGFSNREISQLTGNRWSESTIRKSTKGVK